MIYLIQAFLILFMSVLLLAGLLKVMLMCISNSKVTSQDTTLMIILFWAIIINIWVFLLSYMKYSEKKEMEFKQLSAEETISV
jgi:TM2 domain-containing membrane protein YozV